MIHSYSTILLKFIIIDPSHFQRIYLLQFIKEISKLKAEFTNAFDIHELL